MVHEYFSHIALWWAIFSVGVSLCTIVWSWCWRSSWRWYIHQPPVSNLLLSHDNLVNSCCWFHNELGVYEHLSSPYDSNHGILIYVIEGQRGCWCTTCVPWKIHFESRTLVLLSNWFIFWPLYSLSFSLFFFFFLFHVFVCHFVLFCFVLFIYFFVEGMQLRCFGVVCSVWFCEGGCSST